MKFAKLLIALLCCILLTACSSDKKITGEITDFRGDTLTVTTQKGKQYEFRMSESTAVFSWVDDTDREALKANWENTEVSVSWQRQNGARHADMVIVEATLTRDARRLSDGTAIDVWDNGWRKEYRLEDGTALLMEQEPVRPEDTAGFDSLEETARKAITAYYAQKEPYYDMDRLLEEAYQVYSGLQSERFLTRVVVQDVFQTAQNDRILCYRLSVTLPVAAANGYNDEISEAAVFDRETGAHIDGFDLFTCTPAELENFLLDQLNLTAEQRAAAELNLKPEQIVLVGDGAVEFYLSDCSLPDVVGMMILCLTKEQVGPYLQPWAQMEATEKE